ncbi:hypothetical protein Tco_0598722 [Tanacetum coccineum]
MEQGTDSAWSKSHGKSNRLRCYIYQISGSRADGYDNANVMMAMSVEQLLYWIIDLGGSYHMTYNKDYLFDFEEYDGGNVLIGDGRECRVWGTSKVQVHMRDGSSFVLDKSGKIMFIKSSLVVLSGTRRANCVYTMDGQAVTWNTLKGSKQLGGFQTRWKIKTGNVLDSCNQRSTPQFTKSGVAKHLGIAGIQQQSGLVEEMNVTLLAKVVLYRNIGFNESGEYKKTFISFGVESKKPQDLIDYHSTRDREDSNEAASAVAVVKKIYSHESLTFDNTFSCKETVKKRANTDTGGKRKASLFKSTKEAKLSKPKAGKTSKVKLSGQLFESILRHKIARWQRRSRQKDKDLKISDAKTKSKDNDKGSRSKITKHEGTSLQRRQRQRSQELNDKSNLIDLMKECHNELTSGEIVSLKIMSRTMEVRS